MVLQWKIMLEVSKFHQTLALIRSAHNHVLDNYRLPPHVCFTSFWALLLITHRQGTPTLRERLKGQDGCWYL